MARVCVIRQQVAWSPRAAREVAALAEAGHDVDYICVRGAGDPVRERRGRVTVWRVPLPVGDSGDVATYLMGYSWFFVSAATLAGALHLRRRYRLVQVNTLPDVLVFAAAVPRLLGARVLLDLQECMPEFFATKFGTDMRHPAVRVIAALEQLSIRFAHHVITPTAQLRSTFIGRGAPAEKIDVVVDGADEAVFRPIPSVRSDPEWFTLVSHGTVEERYGLDTAIAAVARLRAEIPELRLKIIGAGSDVDRLRTLATDLRVSDRVTFSDGFVPVEDLVSAIASADVGVVAMKRDAFRDLTLAGKMFDYIAMGIPMAVSRTRSVMETFPPGACELFDSGDPDDLADAIRRLHADPRHRARLAAAAASAAAPYRWPRQRERYLEIAESLLDRQPLSRPFRAASRRAKRASPVRLRRSSGTEARPVRAG
jgi:glycosyltransferase involved in cell wall biosynthesis